MSDADRLAEIIKDAPHSFQVIRARSNLKLTDVQFTSLMRANPARFKAIVFAKKNDQGQPILPGRPGVKLIGP